MGTLKPTTTALNAMLKFLQIATALLSVKIALATLPVFASEALMVVGGQNYDEFLGCINCGKYALESMTNPYGLYSSKYSLTSIFNKYSLHGSRYSITSACSPMALYPPAIVDSDGNFYGYLTLNRMNPKANRKLFGFLEVVCR